MAPALALCRFAHVVPLMFGFGAGLFLVLSAPGEARRRLTAPTRRWAATAAGFGLAAGLLLLAIETAAFADDPRAAVDPESLWLVLSGTSFGEAWAAHLLLGALLVCAFLTPRAGWPILTALFALALASLGLVGHAVMQNGALGVAHRANDALHLLAAGAWLGGLPLFVCCLDLSKETAVRPDAVKAMMRFSTGGHVYVAVVVATGIVNAALTTGLPFPPDSPYRILLLVKVAVVTGMIALAVINRYALVPRLAHSPQSVAAIRRITIANVALGAAVVGLVSAFGLMNPA